MVIKITNEFNRVFIWWDSKSVKSYATKQGAIRAIERKYNLSYIDSSIIYNDKLNRETSNKDLLFIEERLNKLENKKVNVISAKKRRLFKKIGKDFEKYRDLCGVDSIRFFIHKRKDGGLVKHHYLYKYCGLSIDRITTGNEYIERLKEAIENLEKNPDLENAKKIIKNKTIEDINEDSIGWKVFITHLYKLLCVDDEDIKTKEVLNEV